MQETQFQTGFEVPAPNEVISQMLSSVPYLGPSERATALNTELLARLHAGDPAARSEVVTTNMRIIRQALFGYHKGGKSFFAASLHEQLDDLPAIDVDDLWQEGLMVIDRYFPSWKPTQANLVSYIKRPLATKIMQHFKATRTVRLPVYVGDTVSRLYDRDPVSRRLGLLASEGNFSRGETEIIQDVQFTETIPLEHSVDEAGRESVSHEATARLDDESHMAPEAAAEHVGTMQQLERVKNALDEREWDILCRRFGLGTHHEETHEEMAPDWGVSRERIRQLQNKALYTAREVLSPPPAPVKPPKPQSPIADTERFKVWHEKALAEREAWKQHDYASYYDWNEALQARKRLKAQKEAKQEAERKAQEAFYRD